MFSAHRTEVFLLHFVLILMAALSDTALIKLGHLQALYKKIQSKYEYVLVPNASLIIITIIIDFHTAILLCYFTLLCILLNINIKY